MKLQPSVLIRIHELHAQGLSNRDIASDVGCSEPSVRRALKTPLPAASRPTARVQEPVLLSRPLQEPAPCPDDAPAQVRKLYTSLAQRGLWSELDALTVACDLDAPRCHLLLNWFDVDRLLCRLESVEGSIDLDAAVDRLRDAAHWDDRLRAWCRDVAAHADQ